MRRKAKLSRNSRDNELLEELSRTAHRIHACSLTYAQYLNSGGRYSEEAFRDAFGSFPAALELCGLKAGKQPAEPGTE